VTALLWPTVIASEAKQSIPPRAEPWIASSRSLLAMTAERPNVDGRDKPGHDGREGVL
jgi:hypothetical protein